MASSNRRYLLFSFFLASILISQVFCQTDSPSKSDDDSGPLSWFGWFGEPEVKTTKTTKAKVDVTTVEIAAVTSPASSKVMLINEATTMAKKDEDPAVTIVAVEQTTVKIMPTITKAAAVTTNVRTTVRASTKAPFAQSTAKKVRMDAVATMKASKQHHNEQHHKEHHETTMMAKKMDEMTKTVTMAPAGEQPASGKRSKSLTWASTEAEALEIPDVSPCYSALYFGVLSRANGRIDVVEQQTAQFSLNLNGSSEVYTSPNYTKKYDCSEVWVRIFVEPMNNVESSLIVDSNKERHYPELVRSRIVKVSRYGRPLHNYARGTFLGYASLNFQGLPESFDTKRSDFNASLVPESEWITFRSGKVATFRESRPADVIFQIVVFTLIILGNTGIGLNVNWKEIRDVIRRPIGPVIGFCCQYIVMPLTAFGVVKLIELPPNIALGVFLIGCAPGGGGSNFHTYFLGGNLPLSVTMTFVSTCAAIGMMPFWVFTLGKLVVNESQSGITIDFKGILGSLVNSILPFLIGIFVNWKRPLVAKRIFNVFVRPLLALIFVYLISVGMVTNLYLFKLMQPKVLLAGVMLPYIGFSLGFIVALVAKQGVSIATTIAIETGIQSTGVAITTLILSLPQPDADIAIVGPLAVTMFTPVPLWIAEIIRGVYLCIKKKRCFIFDSCRKGKKEVEEGKKKVEIEDTDDDDVVSEVATSFSGKMMTTQFPALEDGNTSTIKKQPPPTFKSAPVNDSALQPLLQSPAVEEALGSLITESETSTIVPQEPTTPVPEQPPTPTTSDQPEQSSSATTRKQSSSSEASSAGGDEVKPLEKTSRPGLTQDPRSIESIYMDAEQ